MIIIIWWSAFLAENECAPNGERYRAYNGSLGLRSQRDSRGRAYGRGSVGRSPTETELY